MTLALLVAVCAPGRAARAQSTSSLLQAARARLEDIQPDTAASLLARALDPRAGASAEQQQRGWTLLGVAELMRGRTVSARQAFRHSLERNPALSIDSLAYLHSELRRVFAAEREAYRLESDEGPPAVAVRVPADTVIMPFAGQWPIEVQPRRPARIVATVTRADGRSDVLWADTAAVNLVGVIAWDLHGHGTALPPGRYALRVVATDSLGRTSVPVMRTLSLTRTSVDTLAIPDPPTDSLRPDSTGTHGPASSVLAGAALGAGALALTSLVGNSSLNSGRSDGSRYVIAGAVSIAGVVGFLTGRHERAVPGNASYNGQVRERWLRQRADVEAENQRRIAAAPMRVRLEAR